VHTPSQNTDLTVHDIAREEHVTAAYIYMILRLPWLAPDITTRNCQRSPTATTQRQKVNAQGLPAPRQLD
jgi:hypothetical protein